MKGPWKHNLLCNKASQMRSRNIAVARVLLKDFGTQDLVAEILHCFWGEELEGLRDGHR